MPRPRENRSTSGPDLALVLARRFYPGPNPFRTMAYQNITPPAGEKIRIENGILQVPANPIIPFIEGDGTGRDIWRASVRVFDAAVEKAYGGQRQISWFEVLAGEKAFNQLGS